MKTPPPARLLAEMCLVRAWDDDTDDESRQLLEMAAESLGTLCDRLELQSLSFERLESRIATLESNP